MNRGINEENRGRFLGSSNLTGDLQRYSRVPGLGDAAIGNLETPGPRNLPRSIGVLPMKASIGSTCFDAIDRDGHSTVAVELASLRGNWTTCITIRQRGIW